MQYMLTKLDLNFKNIFFFKEVDVKHLDSNVLCTGKEIKILK